MHYHIVTDEWWMKEKDNIVETMGNFQNKVLQPISQRECFLVGLRSEIRKLQRERSEYSWWQCAFTKHDEVLDIDNRISERRALIRKTEHEIDEAYEYMMIQCSKIQRHWFDLVGIGYSNVPPRLTDEDFERLDKRWADAHPDEEIE